MTESQEKMTRIPNLDQLVCPLTKTTLRYDREKNELISDAAKLAFPIKDDIPILLVGEAREVE